MNYTSLGKLLLRLGVGAYFILWGLEIFGFGNSQITNFLSPANSEFSNLNIDNSILFEIFRSGFVILGSFLIAGFLTSYSSFVLAILSCFILSSFDKNLLLLLTPLVAIVFLGSGKYGLDYLFGKKSKFVAAENEYIKIEKPQPLEVSKPHIEHKKQKIQVVTKTKKDNDEDGKTIIEI